MELEVKEAALAANTKQVWLSNNKSNFIQEAGGAALFVMAKFLENTGLGSNEKIGAKIEKALDVLGLKTDTDHIHKATVDKDGNMLDYGDSYTIPLIVSKKREYSNSIKGIVETPNGQYRDPQRNFSPLAKWKME